MTGHIFSIQNDGTLVEMNEAPFASEDIFQELLERYPNLLAGDQIDSSDPRRWLLIGREIGIPSEEQGGDRWSLDHLFLDQDAIPTLVEVKRSSDSRIRREVVGQMLDYAANAVVHWPVERIRSQFERQCETAGVDPDQRLSDCLGDNSDLADYWQTVKTNLELGRIRMLFVADIIPRELQRIVEFLNEQMSPAEVLAVEIRHFVGTGLKTLVPRIIGQSARTEVRSAGATGRRKPPTEDEFVQIAQDNGVGDLYETALRQLRPFFPNAPQRSQSNINLVMKIDEFASPVCIVCLFPARSSGSEGLFYKVFSERLAKKYQLEIERVAEVMPGVTDKGTEAFFGGYVEGYCNPDGRFDEFVALLQQHSAS